MYVFHTPGHQELEVSDCLGLTATHLSEIDPPEDIDLGSSSTETLSTSHSEDTDSTANVAAVSLICSESAGMLEVEGTSVFSDSTLVVSLFSFSFSAFSWASFSAFSLASFWRETNKNQTMLWV